MQNKKVRISVAMASYNGASYIKEQLDSILLNLSFEDEVIISDDGSTDGTRSIIEEYVKREPRIVCIDGPQKGIKKNFENAIRHCRGRYIFLSDQDDMWMPDKVNKVLTVFEKQQCSLVMHDAKVVNADDMQEIMLSFFSYRKSRKGAFANIWKNSYMGCCMAFTDDIVKDILPIPDEIQMHDQWIGVKNDLKGRGTYLLNEPLIYYKRHENNNSDFSHNNVFTMILNRLIFLRALLRKRN